MVGCCLGGLIFGGYLCMVESSHFLPYLLGVVINVCLAIWSLSVFWLCCKAQRLALGIATVAIGRSIGILAFVAYLNYTRSPWGQKALIWTMLFYFLFLSWETYWFLQMGQGKRNHGRTEGGSHTPYCR